MRHYGVCIPNNMAAKRPLDDIDLSQDEVKRLGNALKDENFRKMLLEYAEEISDPENRRKAEEEIAMMENERGMNVQFIHPEPGYVLKTTVDGSTKAFINICQNDKIEKPVAKRQVGPDGKSGLMWQIPHSFAPPKDDYDKSNNKCKVFDVVFHPDTYRMATKNERFSKLVEDTAVDGIERQFSVKLDKRNIKHPKLKFKGTPTATVIRERIPDGEKQPTDPDSILNQFPYPYDNKTSAEKAKENVTQNGKAKSAKEETQTESESKFTEPKYTITHRSQVDMSEYRNSPDAKTSTRPTELSVKIELPLLKSAAQANLEIYEKRLVLESVAPAAYKLDLKLPYPVNEEEGSAKFDKSKRTLTITLPVIPLTTPPIPFTTEGEEEKSDLQECDNQPPPLIEVLGEKVNGFANENHVGEENFFSDSSKRNPSTEDTTENHTDGWTKPKFPENVKWQVPDYQFSQDNETVNFVIKVHNADQSSVDLSFPGSSAASIRFLSVGAGLFPVYYSFALEFPDGCKISPAHCSVDVSSENLVVLLLKDKASRGMWDSFKAGVSFEDLQDKQFLTESNLQRELSRLAQESAMPAQEETTPEVSVVEMNEKKLTIDIKPHKSKRGRKSRKDSTSSQEEEEEGDEYDDSAPSSAEIHVIHKHPTPKNLHGILKQRTVSESSEDLSQGQGYAFNDLDSPRSEGEEQLGSSGGASGFKKHRSVSFNSHVDHTSFKASASVSSMTPALKSKRRRQRKREERMRRGGRSNSEGGTSSSEECGKMGLSHSEGEEEMEEEGSKPRAGLSRSVSDPGVESSSLSPIADKREEEEEEREQGKGAASSPALQVADGGEKCAKASSIPGSNRVLDFRTSPALSKGKGAMRDSCEDTKKSAGKVESGGGDVASVKGQGAKESSRDAGKDKSRGLGQGEGASTTEQLPADKNKRIVSEIRSKLAKSGGGDGETKGSLEDSDDDDFQDAVSSMADDVAAKVSLGHSSANTATSQEGSPGTSELAQHAGAESASVNGNGSAGDRRDEEKSEGVETMLSWQEGGGESSEHRTECAFKFSNSLMFDLDVD